MLLLDPFASSTRQFLELTFSFWGMANRYSIPNDKSLHGLLRNLFSNISEFNWKTFLLGTSCVLFLMSTKKIASRYPRFKWTRAAGPLILTVFCIVLQATIDLEARGSEYTVVGTIIRLA